MPGRQSSCEGPDQRPRFVRHTQPDSGFPAALWRVTRQWRVAMGKPESEAGESDPAARVTPGLSKSRVRRTQWTREDPTRSSDQRLYSPTNTGWIEAMTPRRANRNKSAFVTMEACSARKRSFRVIPTLPPPRFKDHPLPSLAVHRDEQWLGEAQLPHASLLFQCLLRFQPGPVYRAFASIRIYCEVADLKGHQILEEMTSLRRDHMKISEGRLE